MINCRGDNKWRPRFRARAALAAAALWFAAACGRPAHPLLGEWVSMAHDGPPLTYVFRGDGRAVWVTELSDQPPDSFEVDYAVNYVTSPVQLDVGPWLDGPIRGQTLQGIVEFQGPDRFRVDFEPANLDSDGADRPASFSDQTVTFVRKVN